MKTFKTYLSEQFIPGRGIIKSSGQAMEYDKNKYITPFLGSKEHTHVLATDHGDMKAGTNLKLHKTEMINGKLHVHASDEQGNKQIIQVSKIHKPGDAPKNEGTNYEKQTFKWFQKYGLTPKDAEPAGSGGGTDVPIINKKKQIVHGGKITSGEDILNGEVKQGHKAAFGQLTIQYHPKKGWHIPDDAKKKRPKYAAEIEKAGILKHLNKYHRPDKDDIKTTDSGRAQNVYLKHPDLKPAESYLQDHHVHVLHVGSGYGTYYVGDKDETGHGLPKISGTGKWTIRDKAKNLNKRTVMFQPDGVKGLNRSDVNLDKEDHIQSFAKTLGH
jgi:hypothetical protein